MNAKEYIRTFQKDTLYSKEEIRTMVHEKFPSYGESALTWTLQSLKHDGALKSVGKGIYQLCDDDGVGRVVYTCQHSLAYHDIENAIGVEYPLVDFQMWELTQMNEFVNHLLAKNTIFVDVEPGCESFVFESLHDKWSDVLYCPTVKQYYRQQGNGTTVVIGKLVTESPRPVEGHASPIEKILVDLFAKKLTGQIISRSEYPAIIEDCFRKFAIDEVKMMRYARRRNLEIVMKEYIDENTSVSSQSFFSL